MYCDLKPSNILLDEKGSLKLGGFGLSQKIASVKPFTMQQVPLLKCLLWTPHTVLHPAFIAHILAACLSWANMWESAEECCSTCAHAG